MAVKIIERLLSDLTGELANRTTRFAIDGKEFTIDLTEEEDQELRDFLERYVRAGVRSPKRATASTVDWRPSPTGNGVIPPAAIKQGERRKYLDLVRAWAKEKRIAVSHFGRIPQMVIDMYENRHALEAAAIAEAAERVNSEQSKAAHDVITGKTNGHKPPVKSVQAVTPKPIKRAPGTVGAELKVAAALFSSAEAAATPSPAQRKKAAPATRVTVKK